ncbi:MAG: TauD/TfdA family dioxygenase [Alphaproteobacteria bacterium]|nr:TauD/TfdA family dioxygenase [Alphaproteobacteria bacterium]
MPRDEIGATPFAVQPQGKLIGAEISQIDLTQPLPDSVFDAVSETFDQYSVVVFRDQDLTGEQRIAFSKRFGPLQINVRSEFNNPRHPEIYTVSNILKDGKPIGSQDAGRYWHSDLCYLEKPTKASMLYAIEVPRREGASLGDTVFASARAAYDDLPQDMKQRLEGLRAVNSYNAMFDRKAAQFGVRPKLNDEAKSKYPKDAIHPVIRTHPNTGEKCIYVCEGYTTQILDIPEAESRELLEFLFAHVTQPKYQYRHSWRKADLLMWDNCAVQHLASFDYAPLHRHMERTTVEGSVPY